MRKLRDLLRRIWEWICNLWPRLKRWQKARVRFLFKFGGAPDYPYYVKISPQPGFGFRWFNDKKYREHPRGHLRRIRWGPQHGLQLMQWHIRFNRWMVREQILGHSTVKGELKHGSVRNAKRRRLRW